MIERRPALGKGLSALIPDVPEPPRSRRRSKSTSICSRRTSSSRACRWTTRSSRSWRSRSRPTASFSRFSCAAPARRYRIIAGERRWRAAQRAGLLKVPVVVRDVADGSTSSCSSSRSIENIQRENLNPVDEALAYQRLADEFVADAGTDRRGRRQGPQLGRQLHAAAEAARGGARRSRVGRAVDGTRPRAAGAARTRPRSGTPPAKSSRARCRCATPRRWSRSSRRRSRERRGPAPRAAAGRRAHPRRRGSDALRPGHEGPHRPARRRRDASRLISAPKTS